MSFIFKNHKKNINGKIILENNLYTPIIQIVEKYDFIKIIDLYKFFYFNN